MAAKAFTIVIDEQIRKKVFRAVRGTFRITPGSVQWSGCAKRRMTYVPISEVKNITSLSRNTHMPSLLL